MSTIGQQFDDIDDFDELLAEAEAQASTEWEMKFVEDLNTRYENAKDPRNVQLTDAQLTTLRGIAKREG